MHDLSGRSETNPLIKENILQAVGRRRNEKEICVWAVESTNNSLMIKVGYGRNDVKYV